MSKKLLYILITIAIIFGFSPRVFAFSASITSPPRGATIDLTGTIFAPASTFSISIYENTTATCSLITGCGVYAGSSGFYGNPTGTFSINGYMPSTYPYEFWFFRTDGTNVLPADYYISWHYDGTNWNYYDTNLTTITPDGITTETAPVASSSVPYNVNFTGSYTNSSSNYRELIINATTTGSSLFSSSSITVSSGSNLPYNLNLLLTPNQAYSYTVQMCQADGIICSTPTPAIDFTTNALSSTPTIAYTPETCDWTTPSTYGGCIANIFRDVFFPSSDSLSQFQNLATTYKNKAPFGYISAIQTTLATVNDTGTSVFSLSSMPILNTYIFNPLRLAFSWILWLAFAFLLFRRFKDIQL